MLCLFFTYIPASLVHFGNVHLGNIDGIEREWFDLVDTPPSHYL